MNLFLSPTASSGRAKSRLPPSSIRTKMKIGQHPKPNGLLGPTRKFHPSPASRTVSTNAEITGEAIFVVSNEVRLWRTKSGDL